MIDDNPKNKADFLGEIERILEPYMTRRQFKSGRILWNEGEKADKMVTIVKGKVKIFRLLPDGNQVPIYLFGPGDTFGFLPFIDGSSYPASAQAIEDTQALVMTQEKLLESIRKDPGVAVYLLAQLGKRLRSAFDQIERLSTRKILPKVASALLSLSTVPGKGGRSEIITLPVPSREYAAFLGLAPESFSRGITRLADLGIIHRLGGNSFQILDHDRLYSEAQKFP